MPNYIDIQSNNASATLDAGTINGNCAIELHFQSTKPGKQILLSMVSYSTLDIPETFWIFIDSANTIGFSYRRPLGKEINTLTCSFPTNIIDGNWHQLALNFTGGDVIFYLDGNPILDGGQPQRQTLPTPIDYVGYIVLGHSEFTDPFGNSPFIGGLTEIRLWNDSSKFVPTPFSPVGPNATSLANYWPFWSNYAKGTDLDVCTAAASSAPATFSNCALAYSSSTLIYDPWNEAVLNAASQPFPAFDAGQEAAAVADLFGQLVAFGAIQPASANLPAFRKLYGNPEKMVPSTLPIAISNAKPSQSDPDYQQAFASVRQQLLAETQTVQSVYQFRSDATAFVQSYYQNINSSINAIIAANFQPVTAFMSVDPDDILELAKSLLEFVTALAAEDGGTRAAGDPESSESGSAALSLVFSLLRFALSGEDDDTVEYEQATKLSHAMSDIVKAVTDAFNTYMGTLSGNVSAVVGDWGRLSTIYAHSDAFTFPYTFTQQIGDTLFQAYNVAFSQQLLIALYQIWEVQCVMDQDINHLGYYNTDILNPYFCQFSPSVVFPGYYNFFGVCTFDKNPQVVSFTSAPSQSVADFLQNTCKLTTSDILNWPFARDYVNTLATPETPRPAQGADV